MAAQIIDGKALAARIVEQVKLGTQEFSRAFSRRPGLAVVLVGEDPASQIYVRNKRKRCEELGFVSRAYDLPAATTEAELLELLSQLNQDAQVDGILVQLPLPAQIRADRIIDAIDPNKDVDGLTPYCLGRLFSGTPKFVPCTPAGVMELIKTTGIDLTGKNAVVVGRSNMVGKPMAMLLLQENATVTLCHSRTKNLAEECRRADVLVAAVGKKNCIPGEYVKPGAVVIDIGTTRDSCGLCGDVAFTQAREIAGFITPVPGGVGPMTIAMLMVNTLKAAQLKEGNHS